jgi:L-ribulose-5-phosphate 3-epimerase
MKTKTTRRDFIVKSLLATSSISAAWNAKAETAPTNWNAQANDKAAGKISVFSKSLHWLNYQDMASAVAELGFDGIDLTVRPEGHVLPERVAEDLPKAVEIIRKAGLEVYMITTAITDADAPHTEAILKTANQLGIRYYRTGWLAYQDALSIPQNLDAFKSQFSKLARLNKKYAIHGDYQNHAGTHLGGSLWDLWLVLKDIDPQWLGCQYDIRHATVEAANAWPLGLKLIQSHIRVLDIKDFQWGNKNGKTEAITVPLGTGIVDYKKYLPLIKQYQLRCPYSIHYEFPLGGAENGAKVITMKKEEVLAAMKKDLDILKIWLKEAGLDG